MFKWNDIFWLIYAAMNIAADHADAFLYFLFGDQYSLYDNQTVHVMYTCYYLLVSPNNA